jgi:hypothetical protein
MLQVAGKRVNAIGTVRCCPQAKHAARPTIDGRGRKFGSMNEHELADIWQRHGWELPGESPL